MGRAFSPYDICGRFPGASPQAGMGPRRWRYGPNAPLSVLIRLLAKSHSIQVGAPSIARHTAHIFPYGRALLGAPMFGNKPDKHAAVARRHILAGTKAKSAPPGTTRPTNRTSAPTPCRSIPPNPERNPQKWHKALWNSVLRLNWRGIRWEMFVCFSEKCATLGAKFNTFQEKLKAFCRKLHTLR